MNRKIGYLLAGIFLYILLISASVLFAEPPPSGFFLTPNIQNNPIFAIAARNKDSSEASLEKVKIRFLLEAVRKSRLTFIRNGVSYKGPRAADHLTRKYLRDGDRIHTARDFIRVAASKSNGTGKLYFVENAHGEIAPVKDVLHAELERLEQSLAAKTAAAHSLVPRR